jgi:propionyl-CoA carboxylase beta chain
MPLAAMSICRRNRNRFGALFNNQSNGSSMTEKTSRDLLAEIEQAKLAVSDHGRPEAVEKRHSRDLMTARERIAVLVDDDSFVEMGSLVQPERNNDLNKDLNAPADGVVTGTAKIAGRAVNVASFDYTVYGGSMGKVGSIKNNRLVQRSVDHGMPMVTAMMGQGFAGPTNYASVADFVVMIKGIATMGMAGPALVKAGTGKEIDKEELGGWRTQADKNGIADLAVDTEEECLRAVGKFLSYLPSNAELPPPIVNPEAPAGGDCEDLLDIVPADGRKTYDVRKVIEIIADKDSVFELKPGYARNAITAFTRLAGKPVGFIANQPMRKGGILDSDASEKIAHFIALCDAYGLPLVYLVDVPGFSIGPPAEAASLGRRSGRMFFEAGISTVPRISIVLRKGYGGGYYAMAGGDALGADVSYVWPTAEICAMSIEGAVDVAYRKEFQNADDPAAARQALIDEIRTQIGPLKAADDFGIDEVIDPRQTRDLLIKHFDHLSPRRPDPNPRRKRPISPI